ncbi:MAG: type II toxin-antitoxin system VapC family toxin [Planctomycetes bacterium]|nr:type II toxin-antitoxin system VapC family toxin [Planctomycetota bacterium]
MTYFLDTNTCIFALKGNRPALEHRFRSVSPADIKVPVIVEAELRFGAEKSRRKRETLSAIEVLLSAFEVVPFTCQATRHYAQIRADLERKGTPIGPNDLIVAATVLCAGGILVTNNVAEFERVSGLPIEDWTR